MLNIKGAKTDMLANQTKAFLKSLAKVIDVNIEDLKVKVSAEIEFYILDKNKSPLEYNLKESKEIKNIISKLNDYDSNIKNTKSKDVVDNNKFIRMKLP